MFKQPFKRQENLCHRLVRRQKMHYTILTNLIEKTLQNRSFARPFHVNKSMKNEIGFNADWNKKMSKLKQKFAVLTDDDLSLEEGKEDKMVTHLQIKLEESQEMVYKIISNL